MKIINIQVDNINRWDAPDYVDAYISYAEWLDGTPLTDFELDRLNQNADFVYEQVLNKLY